MNQVAISVFKAKCLELLDQVQKTKKPLRITRHGKPVADVVPAQPAKQRKVGSMAGTFEIVGDIVSPVIDLNDIEALRD